MKARGEITVFLSLCLLSVAALLCVMIESARTAGSRYYFQTAVNSGLDTLFSRYHRQLWDKYQIMALEYEVPEDLTKSLEDYMDEYLSIDNWYPMKLESMELTSLKGMADNGGDYLAEEVLKYMKYAMVSQFVINPEDGEQLLKDVTEGAGAGSLAGTYDSQEKEVRKLEKTVEKLVENVRQQEKQKDEIWKALSEDDEESFDKAAKEYRKAAEDYPKLMEKYGKQARALAEKQQQSRQKIDEVKPDLQEDRGELFEKQWNPYDTYIDQDGERYKEFQTQEEVTEKNLELLEKVEELVERLLGGQGMVPPGIGDRVIGTGPDLNVEDPPNGLTLSKREAVRVMAPDGSEEEEEEPYYEEDDDDDDDEPVLTAAALMWSQGYTATKLSTEYGTGDKEKRNLLEQAQSMMEAGLLGLVMPEGTVISSGALSLGQFPSKTVGVPEKNGGEKGNSFLERVIIDEYCGHFFPNALSGGEQLVRYELEYILQGEGTDRGNLEKTVAELFAVREGLNLIRILSDSAKREEARALALAITGGVGLAPLAEIAACLIMGVWAMGESVSDLRILMSGGKVPLWKKNGEWRMSLEGLLEMGKNRGAGKGPESFDSGFTYEGYLKLLLLKENPQEKHMRMLDLMQMNIGLEKSGFLIKNCAYYVDIRGKASGKHVFFTLPFVERLVNGEKGYALEAAAGKAY
ncbi:MAG: hypothetical protein HFG77_02345 [Hungatella sp.]|jgi:hypothetical protein|nr:hypothetical protein [Hungatella sp.]